MKARETALKLKRFETDEKARKVADLEHMIREFETIAADLDRQVQAEEDRTGIRDIKHFAYSTFAKSASQRRDNLRASIAELRVKLEAAQKDHDDLKQQLARAAADEPRENTSERSSRRRQERGTSLALR
jgi:flagellar protein FliJ